VNSRFLVFAVLLVAARSGRAQQITSAGQPAQLDIRLAGERSVRGANGQFTMYDEARCGNVFSLTSDRLDHG
jgi:hypothetical protein